MPSDEIEPQISDRGFAHWDPTPTIYGHIVRVYESSAAMAPHLWLNVNQTVGSARVARSNISPEKATAHMSLAQAREIHAKLGAAIKRVEESWGLAPGEEWPQDGEEW